MFERLVLRFIPESLRSDVETFRAGRLLVSASLLTAVFSTSYLLLSLTVGFGPGVWAMVFNAAAFPIVPFVFRGTRSISVGTHCYVLIGAVGVSIVVYYSGGFASPILPWFAVLPIAALLLGGARPGWIWTGVALAIVVAFSIGTISGHVFPIAIAEPYRDLFAVGDHIGLVLLIFVIARVFQSEKVRAFAQVNRKNDQLQVALEDLHRTQAQLVHTEKMASLGQLTTGIAHELQNPLNFVNNFASLSVELIEELQDDLRSQGEDLSVVNPALEDLLLNLGRIQNHGQRADRIIKGMMRHAVEVKGERRSVSLNDILNEFVGPALHGRKAQHPSFDVHIVRHLDPLLGPIRVLPSEIGRVFLNILDNAFYAVASRAEQAGTGYLPTVTITSKKVAGVAVVEVADNGVGIPAAVKGRIFDPFFTTRPAGEGTGLGLSLAYDIVVEGHGGTITVDSKEGEGTTVSIGIPAR